MGEARMGGPARRRAAILVCVLLAAVGGAARAAVPPGAGVAAADTVRAASWSGVTVVCRDGNRLDGVDLTWSLGGYLLEAARPRGDVVTLAPLEVQRVFAADGRDLTDEVGAACPATGISYTLLGRGSRVPFRFAFMGDFGGGLALTASDGGGSPAAVLLGGLRLGFSPWVHLRVGARRQRLTEQVTGPGSVVKTSGTDLLLLLGARVRDPRENDNYVYVEGGLALVHLGERFPGQGGDVRDDRRDFAAPVAQGGVVLPLSPTLGVDLGVTLEYRPSLIEGRDGFLLGGLYAALTWRGEATEP